VLQPLDFSALPTPVEPARRLARVLDMDGDALWIKRDDLTGLGGGGNKIRKLAWLCADALAQGCDTLVTGGGGQSNFVRATAAAANKVGLDCTLVLGTRPVEQPSGNILLDLLFGASVEWAGPLGYAELEAAIEHAAARLREDGRTPYVMPIGGASTIGEQGYVAAAAELREQVPDVDVVVVACGSGGTHAGLAAGFGTLDKVLGVDTGARPDLDEFVPRAASAAAAMAGLPPPTGTVVVDHAQVGDGYAVPTDAGREAVDLLARCEGLVLDPVYTGKAMAGLVAARREGRIERHTRTVFLHTGGMPTLFAPRYAAWVLNGVSDLPSELG
jgi:D-cysteine desulfhydrase family pyridoxal phosphate-dependent enzyme